MATHPRVNAEAAVARRTFAERSSGKRGSCSRCDKVLRAVVSHILIREATASVALKDLWFYFVHDGDCFDNFMQLSKIVRENYVLLEIAD